MLNNLLEFRLLVSRSEFHLPDSKAIFLNSPPVLWSLSSCLLADLAPSAVTSLYTFIFPFSTDSFPLACLNIFIFLSGRKIFFLNLTYTSSHCPTSPLPFPTTLFEPYLQVLILFQSSPAFWILPLSLH